MKNLKSILFITIAFLTLQSFTITTNNTTSENCAVVTTITDECPDVVNYGATIRVYNQTPFPVRVYIGGNDRGYLRGNSYGNYGVWDGNYHVKTVWQNGNSLFWNVSICCGQLFNCFAR